MKKKNHEPRTRRSGTMKRLDEILLNTYEVLEIFKNIKNESEVSENGRLKGVIWRNGKAEKTA